jgi:hypothetical protein
MSFSELWDLTVQLVTSWQIIAVTVVVFFYFFLVSSVGRRRYRSPVSSSDRPKKAKKLHKAPSTTAEEDLLGDGSDLNIEETN